MAAIPIIIVGFRNPADIRNVLEALARADASPRFSVHICENGGSAAFDDLIGVLCGEGALLSPADDAIIPDGHAFCRVRAFTLCGHDVSVLIGEAAENLGYGAGVNAWLRPMLGVDWPGIFVLNPDAMPEPDALAKLSSYADAHGKGMVTGRIVFAAARDTIQTRGLRWRPWLASNAAIGAREPSAVAPDIAELEQTLDAPSGAAVYVTRPCIDRIGLMREDFFLYYEDLDWGLKAKRCCGLGYAYEAVIVHVGGSTIGTGDKRTGSALSTYLEFRNRIIFVRDERPAWLIWSLFISSLRAMEFLTYGRPDKMRAAFGGLLDAMRGRSGRPDEQIRRHLGGQQS